MHETFLVECRYSSLLLIIQGEVFELEDEPIVLDGRVFSQLAGEGMEWLLSAVMVVMHGATERWLKVILLKQSIKKVSLCIMKPFERGEWRCLFKYICLWLRWCYRSVESKTRAERICQNLLLPEMRFVSD